MIKNSNIQRSVVMPKDIYEKLNQMAEENYTTVSNVIKQILIEYFKNKRNICQENQKISSGNDLVD